MRHSKHLSLLCALSAGVYAGVGPSYFEHEHAFYTTDFDKEPGMHVIQFGQRIGIKDDTVHIGRPRIWVNHECALCHCGKEALQITFKKGEPTFLCTDHAPKRHPVNQQKYPTIKQEQEKKKK